VVGVDEDIKSDPFFYFWAPDPRLDSKWRHLQHLYALPVYSILFALWRFNSLKTVREMRLWNEAAPIALNYAWMALFLPVGVAVGHVFLAGAIAATIVTVSHQAEEMHAAPQDDWVAQQIETTRDAVTGNPFSEWLWGGMNYQLEHHLFPTMPRYRYPALVPKIQALCEAHNIEYRVGTEMELIQRNFEMLRRVGQEPAKRGAPATRRDTVWIRRPGAAWAGSAGLEEATLSPARSSVPQMASDGGLSLTPRAVLLDSFAIAMSQLKRFM
jgi:fatty acid desaturase